MKKIYIAFLSIALSLTFFSCDEQLDINSDPLVATEANPNAVLPFVFAEYSARKTTELGTRTADVMHYLGDTFNSPKGGSTSSFLTGNTWQTWYVNLLGNLELIEQDAAEAGEASNNVQAVAKILKAHLFFELTCLWGDVPFTEALDGVNFPTPQFDDQETVLDGVVEMLDEAMALIDAMPAEGSFNFSTGDLLFDGDIQKWKELANSFKIRTLMLIRNVDSRRADAENQLVEAFDEATVSEPVFLEYRGGSGADNGYYDLVRAFFGNSNEDTFVYGPSPTLADQLQSTNDPRLDLWLVDTGSSFDVAPYDNFPSPGQVVFSDNLIRGDYPDIYILPSEILFYQSELLLDGVDVATEIEEGVPFDAQTAFEEAVKYTVNYWGGNLGINSIDGFLGVPVTNDQVSSFVAGLGSVTLEKIHTQQWLEAFLRPVVGWNTVRRTGVPALSPPGNAIIPTILKRFDYPPDEIGANPNTPANPPTDTPMWFENL